MLALLVIDTGNARIWDGRASGGGSSSSVSLSTCFWETRPLFVSARLLGLVWHLAHHQDLLQGFLHVLVHLTLNTQRFGSLAISKMHMQLFHFAVCETQSDVI